MAQSMVHVHLLLLITTCTHLEVFGWAPFPLFLRPQCRQRGENSLYNKCKAPRHNRHHGHRLQSRGSLEEEMAIIRYYCDNNSSNRSDGEPIFKFDDSYQNNNDDDKNDKEYSAWRRQAAEETQRWCRHFVVPYNLCPWAAASVQTASEAMQIYVVPPPSQLQPDIIRPVSGWSPKVERILRHVANDFDQKLQCQQLDPNTAIAFVVIADHDGEIDFASFYEWFVDLEDRWLEAAAEFGGLEDRITLAPFHPDWHFEANNENDNGKNDKKHSALDFEKKSPFPTVSIVSAEVIDQAGEAATRRIGINNAKLLQSKSAQEWEALYDQVVRLPTRSGGDDSSPT